MNQVPKISVIMPLYNSSKYMSEAIDSVLAQTYQDFEIILVDDGSTDNSKEIANRFVNKFPEKIRYIYQENKGIAGARNTGIRNAKGEFIALLDADDKWHPRRLEEEVRVLEASKDIGLVHANIMKISENGEALSTPKREIKYLSGDIFEYLFLRKAEIAALTVLFRKKCCEKVGLFDENPACMGCDDRDLWLRISRQYKIQYIDKVLAYYRIHDQSYSRNSEKMLKARLYVVDKFSHSNSLKKGLKNKALSVIYKEYGDQFLFKKEFQAARKNYMKAIAFKPSYFWAWFNFFKAVCHLNTGCQ